MAILITATIPGWRDPEGDRGRGTRRAGGRVYAVSVGQVPPALGETLRMGARVAFLRTPLRFDILETTPSGGPSCGWNVVVAARPDPCQEGIVDLMSDSQWLAVLRRLFGAEVTVLRVAGGRCV